MKRTLLVVLASLAFSSFANAAITLILNPLIIPNPSGTGPYVWTYVGSLNGSENLSTTTAGTCSQPAGTCTGSFFTIYDIAGYVSETSPSDWTATVQTPGYTGSSQNVTDTSLENVTFWYTGAGQSGPGLLGPFTITSTYKQSTPGSYSYQTDGNEPGLVDQGNGPLRVPSAAPEPASLGLIGASLLGLGAVARRRFKK
jgi:hypothetical protein